MGFLRWDIDADPESFVDEHLVFDFVSGNPYKINMIWIFLTRLKKGDQIAALTIEGSEQGATNYGEKAFESSSICKLCSFLLI